VTRLRLRFTKAGKIRWTSHRDVARMWERAFRRVGLPLAYSAGFSPRPKVSFGLALPTGHESAAEYLDLDLNVSVVDVDVMIFDLTAALPGGVTVTAGAVIDPATPSLQASVVSCTWTWAAVTALPPLPPPPVSADQGTRPGPRSAGPTTGGRLAPDPAPPGVTELSKELLADAVARILAAPEVVITRLRKGVEVTEDIRPSIESLRVLDRGPEVWLEADLASQPRSIRPLEVLRALDPTLDERHVCRLHQWIWRDGARHEPLVPSGSQGQRLAGGGPRSPAGAGAGSVAATDAPHALGRAS